VRRRLKIATILFLSSLTLCSSQSGCRRKPPCPEPGCKENGLCGKHPSGRWHTAESDKDCQRSIECGELGNCTRRNGRCGPGSDNDCRNSKHCKEFGYCFQSDSCKHDAAPITRPRCVACLDQDCKASTYCQNAGDCWLDGVDCVPRTPDDCIKSEYCRTMGQCRLEDGECRTSP